MDKRNQQNLENIQIIGDVYSDERYEIAVRHNDLYSKLVISKRLLLELKDLLNNMKEFNN